MLLSPAKKVETSLNRPTKKPFLIIHSTVAYCIFEAGCVWSEQALSINAMLIVKYYVATYIVLEYKNHIYIS